VSRSNILALYERTLTGSRPSGELAVPHTAH